MMLSSCVAACWRSALVLGIWMLGPAAIGAVRVEQSPDRSVAVTSPTYAARIDAKGNLTELLAGGARTLTHTLGGPQKPQSAVTINVTGNKVAVRNGVIRTEWTFRDEAVHVLAEGQNFEFRVDESVKAVVRAGGKGGAYTPKAMMGGCRALVLTNATTVDFSIPMHLHTSRLFPTAYAIGSVKPADTLEFDVILGRPVEAAELLSGIDIAPAHNDVAVLTEGGNTVGDGFVHFASGDRVALVSTQHNQGKQPMELEYRLAVLDHHVGGRQVCQATHAITIAPDGRAALQWQLPQLAPGFYYATMSAWHGETKYTETKQTFAVDLPHYRTAMTRPGDFAEFWQRQDRKLQEVPLNGTQTLLGAAQGSDSSYEVAFDMPGGTRVRGFMSVSGRPGVTLTANLTRQVDEMFSKARAGQYKLNEWERSQGTLLRLTMPKDALFTDWNSAQDNNLLETILTWLRAADYLSGRSELRGQKIRVFGSSRGGPVAFVAAARRPDVIGGVDIHVPTSAGISWRDKPYRGWGLPKGHDPLRSEHVAKLAAMAAYVDPVNHAPDVRCPVILGYGVDDDLSPPQGIEAMYQHCAASWKRISRDPGGHVYSDGFKKLQAALSAQMQTAAASGTDERIMKDP